jgi:hypothetical protein
MSNKMIGGVVEIPCFRNGLPVAIGSLLLGGCPRIAFVRLS